MCVKKEKITQLIFIYNARSGKVNTYVDAIHKLVKPKSYFCNLCQITYGIFTEKTKWKTFRQNLDIPIEFLYHDEFRKQYASKFSQKFNFPIVLGITALGWEVVVDTVTLNSLSSAQELIEKLEKEIEL